MPAVTRLLPHHCAAPHRGTWATFLSSQRSWEREERAPSRSLIGSGKASAGRQEGVGESPTGRVCRGAGVTHRQQPPQPPQGYSESSFSFRENERHSHKLDARQQQRGSFQKLQLASGAWRQGTRPEPREGAPVEPGAAPAVPGVCARCLIRGPRRPEPLTGGCPGKGSAAAAPSCARDTRSSHSTALSTA